MTAVGTAAAAAAASLFFLVSVRFVLKEELLKCIWIQLVGAAVIVVHI
jgi:hypothetical protein